MAMVQAIVVFLALVTAVGAAAQAPRTGQPASPWLEWNSLLLIPCLGTLVLLSGIVLYLAREGE